MVHDVLLVGLGSYVSVPSCGCHFHMYALRLSTLYIRLLINTRRKVHRFTFSYQNMFVVLHFLVPGELFGYTGWAWVIVFGEKRHSDS